MTSKTIRAAGVLIAAMTAFAATAQAAPDANNGAASTASLEASRGARDGAQDAASDRRRYCIERPSTGTMLPTRVCKTRAEWARTGVQIPSQR